VCVGGGGGFRDRRDWAAQVKARAEARNIGMRALKRAAAERQREADMAAERRALAARLSDGAGPPDLAALARDIAAGSPPAAAAGPSACHLCRMAQAPLPPPAPCCCCCCCCCVCSAAHVRITERALGTRLLFPSRRPHTGVWLLIIGSPAL
jgi:hypothetical protein